MELGCGARNGTSYSKPPYTFIIIIVTILSSHVFHCFRIVGASKANRTSLPNCSRVWVVQDCNSLGIRYGKYCGVGWTGYPGEEPCDDLDACCKLHDECIEKKGGYTLFTPHYITWYCPQAFVLSKQCKSQCINHGRYCAPDPEHDFNKGYDGKDVVIENLRQLCVFKVATESKKSWVWWDYVTDFQIRCPMKEKKYNKECAEEVITSLGLDSKKIDKCMGDPEADAENSALKAKQDAQVGHDSRGDVTILPTLVINNRQYRGKLDKIATIKAICEDFEEITWNKGDMDVEESNVTHFTVVV